MTLGSFPLTQRMLRILWLVAVLVVIVGSLLPGNSSPMRMLGTLHINDKVEHLLAYATLSFIPALHERKQTILLLAFYSIAMGVALEYGQRYLGWRDFEVADMVADAIGVIFGLILAPVLRSLLEQRTQAS